MIPTVVGFAWSRLGATGIGRNSIYVESDSGSTLEAVNEVGVVESSKKSTVWAFHFHEQYFSRRSFVVTLPNFWIRLDDER